MIFIFRILFNYSENYFFFFCETQTIFYTVKIQEDISKNRLIIPLTVLTFFSQTIFLTPQKNIKIQLTFFLKKKISQTSLEIS